MVTNCFEHLYFYTIYNITYSFEQSFIRTIFYSVQFWWSVSLFCFHFFDIISLSSIYIRNSYEMYFAGRRLLNAWNRETNLLSYFLRDFGMLPRYARCLVKRRLFSHLIKRISFNQQFYSFSLDTVHLLTYRTKTV